MELSFTGAGCLRYILFPIPAIRFSHRDTRHSHSMATTIKGASDQITVVKGPVKTFKKPFKRKRRKGYPCGLDFLLPGGVIQCQALSETIQIVLAQEVS
jgi:hypothetical protein